MKNTMKKRVFILKIKENAREIKFKHPANKNQRGNAGVFLIRGISANITTQPIST